VQHAAGQQKSNLKLPNSFELLGIDSELVTGEAKSSDKDTTATIMDMQMVKNPNVEVQSLGEENLNHSTRIE